MPNESSIEEFGAEWATKMGALSERMGIQLVESSSVDSSDEESGDEESGDDANSGDGAEGSGIAGG